MVPDSRFTYITAACSFDGEAMLHAVYFSEGKAMAYHNHWLRTPRWFAERAHKAALYLRVRSCRAGHACFRRCALCADACAPPVCA